jgi:hypothetical protein
MPFAVLSLLLCGLLVASGLRSNLVRAFALGVPNINPVATARAHQPVCEGPVQSGTAFQLVVVSGRREGGVPEVRIWAATGAHSRLIAAAVLGGEQTRGFSPYEARLSTAVRSGVGVNVCISDADGAFVLQGDRPGDTGAEILGGKPRRAFSLVLFEGGRHSFVGSLGLAFSRAALFRPSWVGAWTFWALLVGLLVACLLGGFALVAAIRAESSDSA